LSCIGDAIATAGISAAVTPRQPVGALRRRDRFDPSLFMGFGIGRRR
jgi:hypothetical protein